MQTLNKEEIGDALGRIATGVYVITLEQKADQSSAREGMLATWIMQVAFDPPMISIAVKDERPILKHLTKEANVVVNILAKHNHDIFKNFAKPNISQEERFDSLPLLAETEYGPIFASCHAYLACKIKEIVPAGDHFLVLAEVIKGALLHPEAEPIIHLRKNGFQY
jgi:flavin reductase (DIM6/NTAB) family NADH-FMN oxidoreductase RutF